MDTTAFVAQVIRAVMAERDLTPAVLSDAARIPIGELRDRLAANSPFTLAELDRIASALDTRPSRLLERAAELQEPPHNEGNQS